MTMGPLTSLLSRSATFAKLGAILGFFIFAAGAASAAGIDLNGKWAGIYSCGNDSGNMRMTIADESGVIVGIETLSTPDISGAIKTRVTTGPDGRVSFLPLEWIGSKHGGMPTLTGAYDAGSNTVSGTMSGCRENGAFTLTRDASVSEAFAPSQDPRSPTSVSGGPAQGHWQGQLACKRNKRTPAESVPVEADIVQDGEGVAALFRIHINKKAGTDSDGTVDHIVVLRGLYLHGRMDLSWPAIIANTPSQAWRFFGLTVTFDADARSASGTPKMKLCDAITLQKVGPPATKAIPGEWAGLWMGSAGHTRSSLMLVPDKGLGELRTNYPIDRAPENQDRLVTAMAPLYAQDGKVLFVPMGARLGTGKFEHAEDYGVYGHIQAKSRGFVVGASGSDTLSFHYIYKSSELARAFEAGEGDLDTTRDGLLLKKVDPATATLMASGATPPMPLGGGFGGQLAEAATQEDQCKVLLAWIKPFGGSDGFGGMHIPVDEVLKRVTAAYADDLFVPVFGVPYPMLSKKELWTMHDMLPRCGRTLGAKVLSDSTIKNTFSTDLIQRGMAQRVIERADALAWLAEKQKQIEVLPDESASMDELKRLHRAAEDGLKALAEPERKQFKELAATRSADIEAALLERQVAEIAGAANPQGAFDRLVALKRKIDKSDATPQAKTELSREIAAKAKELGTSLIVAAQEEAAAVPHSLDGLAAIHAIRIRTARVAGTLHSSFGVNSDGELRPIARQERAMLDDPSIQSAFRDRLMAVKPTGDPFDAVRVVASRYLDTDRLGDRSPPYGAYTKAVNDASAQAEIASVDFHDVSGMASPDEPTAEMMLQLVLQRVNGVNDGVGERERRCIARDFQNDPMLAIECMQLMTVTDGKGGFRVRLKSFSKLGCVPHGSNRQFECQFEASLDNNSSMYMGELGRIFSMPGVQKALLVHNADDSWTMIY